MHGWMSGWDWAWMSFVMIFWVSAVAATVYVASSEKSTAELRRQHDELDRLIGERESE